jgi:hypothetical protein
MGNVLSTYPTKPLVNENQKSHSTRHKHGELERAFEWLNNFAEPGSACLSALYVYLLNKPLHGDPC